jgi:hypothetical protein
MDTPTTRSAWRTVLIEQGRTLAWLADRTPAWLTAASVVLGVDVTERAA